MFFSLQGALRRCFQRRCRGCCEAVLPWLRPVLPAALGGASTSYCGCFQPCRAALPLPAVDGGAVGLNLGCFQQLWTILQTQNGGATGFCCRSFQRPSRLLPPEDGGAVKLNLGCFHTDAINAARWC